MALVPLNDCTDGNSGGVFLVLVPLYSYEDDHTVAYLVLRSVSIVTFSNSSYETQSWKNIEKSTFAKPISVIIIHNFQLDTCIMSLCYFRSVKHQTKADNYVASNRKSIG